MICAECGQTNREGATYCDACGTPLSVGVIRHELPPDDDGGAPAQPQDKPSGLVGAMTADWTARSALAGLFGLVGAFIAASMGSWGFVLLFALVSAAGWGFLIYTLRNAP